MTAQRQQAVIWDVDGTLVDTAELHFRAWDELARLRGLLFTRADFTATFGRRNPEILRQLFGSMSEQQLALLGEQKEDLYRNAARQGVDLLPGVRKLLEALAQAGFPQAIGSSAPRGNLDLILEITGTARFFAAVVAMEDTSRGKPDPEVFQAAAGKLAVEPHSCLVIEDAPAGIQAARAAGMKCIGVTFVGHHADAVLHEAGADLVVANLEQVSVGKIEELLRPPSSSAGGT